MSTATLLTSPELEKAVFCNRFYYPPGSVTSLPPQLADLNPETAELAFAVGRWQRDHGLYIDGILGPKTAASFQGNIWKPPLGENYFIVNGQHIPTPFPVVHWTNPDGLSYSRVLNAMPNFNGVWKRAPEAASIDTIERLVLHWDECVSSHDCFHVTIWRGLSVQLCLDADGTIYQCMDLVDDMARQARWTNQTSIGIEINNPVSLRQAFGVGGRRIIQAQKPHTGDMSWQHFDFTEAQKTVISRLIPVLCDILAIPRKLPQDDSHEVPKGLIPDPTSYRGVLGHYHLQTDKIDPGYTLWPLLSKVL